MPFATIWMVCHYTRAGDAASPRSGQRRTRLPAQICPAVEVGEVTEGQAVVCACCPCTLVAPPAIGGVVMAHYVALALRTEARHPGHGREEGGVRGHAAARGGEVMAHGGGAVLRLPEAGSPRGPVRRHRSQGSGPSPSPGRSLRGAASTGKTAYSSARRPAVAPPARNACTGPSPSGRAV